MILAYGESDHNHLYVQSHGAQQAIDTLILWQDKLSE